MPKYIISVSISGCLIISLECFSVCSSILGVFVGFGVDVGGGGRFGVELSIFVESGYKMSR